MLVVGLMALISQRVQQSSVWLNNNQTIIVCHDKNVITAPSNQVHDKPTSQQRLLVFVPRQET